ncbi:MAG: YggS family pyridoxal phosphate-dependent enzyme [Anaerolineae bacterium]|jgi:pyridoxal phosphate enzyme (YggS family)|nr:YggS family pyridoxal phosphate-dependent enzyme [Anaerolineae bacterium]
MSKLTDDIAASVQRILDTIPPDVILVAAAKTRTPQEVEAVIQAGITHIGENYVQEARNIIAVVGNKATWHMIGHLQRNKVSRAVRLFDMIETLDSIELAGTINQHCAAIGKTMSVLIEINSGREPNKTGALPEDVDELVAAVAGLDHIQVQGVMTMGPRFGNPEDARPYFRATREVFERLSCLSYPNVAMHYLSMGMSNSYHIAIEEGANVVRLGTALFGSRPA